METLFAYPHRLLVINYVGFAYIAVCIPVVFSHISCPALCILLKTNLNEATGLAS